MYESLDLYDGHYAVSISKTGYKENMLLSDITVRKNERDINVGPVLLPHYATVTGSILNGNDQGVPNVEIFFGNRTSEQLERCRTDPNGKFSTALLITGAGDEEWQARWKREEFSIAGTFTLPLHPSDSATIGEIHLPINFISIPVQDIQGKMLSGVDINLAHHDGSPLQSDDFELEETEPGFYQVRNLPNGKYVVSLQKPEYETGKQIEVSVQGGQHSILAPVKLGHYVTVTGRALN